MLSFRYENRRRKRLANPELIQRCHSRHAVVSKVLQNDAESTAGWNPVVGNIFATSTCDARSTQLAIAC